MTLSLAAQVACLEAERAHTTSASSEHQNYHNPLCFEDGWEAGVTYARKELGGILARFVEEARAASAASDAISPAWIIEVLGPLAEVAP